MRHEINKTAGNNNLEEPVYKWCPTAILQGIHGIKHVQNKDYIYLDK